MANERSLAGKTGALLLGAIVLAVAAPFACDNKPAEPTTADPSPAAPRGDAPPPSTGAPNPNPHGPSPGQPRSAAAAVDEIRWEKPERWKETEHTSSMRRATYLVPRAEGDPEDAELSVIVAGGSTQANIERWEAQFGGSKAQQHTRAVGGLDVTIVELEGTFDGGGPMMGAPSGGPKADFAMLAAIVPTSHGQHYFFKMTGPKKTVKSARAEFDALVDSIAPAR